MTGVGVLKKGFIIHTPTCNIKLPKNTVVFFSKVSNIPTIKVDGIPLTFTKVNGKWYADFYGVVMLVMFDNNKTPYPMCYYK